MKALGLATSLFFALAIAACNQSGSGSGSSGSMYITTCSLGCPSGVGGFQVSCPPLQIAVNQEISVTFSLPVDPSTLDSTTFQLIDQASGAVPVGTRLVDPGDARRVIFRPAIAFDNQGNPSFGFTFPTTYRILIPGSAQGDIGPFINSTSGKANLSRMNCQVQTTSSLVDYVPGPPSVQIQVDLADLSTSNVNDFIANQPADGAVNVWRNSTVRFIFNDVMNPATLASPLTHQPAFASVQVDTDGNLATSADRVTLFGNYVVSIDLAQLQTVMTFTSTIGMPSAGDPLLHPLGPRRIVVTFPSGIQDLKGNALANAGSIAFTPEVVILPPLALPDSDGENFVNAGNLDQARSGASWANGKLTRGIGGGSGRLGPLHIQANQTITLNTDSTVFPLSSQITGVTRDLLDNAVPGVDYTASNPATWPTITVTDGAFEFSSLLIDTAGRLVLTGTKPARLYSRGALVVDTGSIVDLSGSAATVQNSATAIGAAAALSGPNAGKGGKGADRFDHTGHAALIAVGAIPNPGAVTTGATGGGVGLVAGLGSGPGGLRFPTTIPITNTTLPTGAGFQQWSFDDNNLACTIAQPGAPGGGATYAVDGGAGVALSPFPIDEHGFNTLPPNTSPGGMIGLEPPDPLGGHIIRRLEWDRGNLRGGAGGGGGGMSLFGSLSSSLNPPCSGATTTYTTYEDNSACAGGGGGGAVLLVSGQVLTLAGQILANGGDGGSGLVGPTQNQTRSAPGGGGSGGAVKLQAKTLSIAPVPARINISGGAGGQTDMCDFAAVCNSKGGSGGYGLVRMEDTTGTLTRPLYSPFITPFDPNHVNPVTGLIESEQLLSVGLWYTPRKRPDSYSASTSCWMQPLGNFFQLNFIADDLSNPDPNLHTFGWNMDVLYDSGSGPHLFKYRGPDSSAGYPFPSGDFESNIGDKLNHGLPDGTGSYFAVRFQGAKALGSVATNPCDVTLYGIGAQIAPGSLTPWVRQPSDLNSFTPRPNMIRFCVVFDNSLVTSASIPMFIKGVTNLKILVQPD